MTGLSAFFYLFFFLYNDNKNNNNNKSNRVKTTLFKQARPTINSTENFNAPYTTASFRSPQGARIFLFYFLLL